MKIAAFKCCVKLLTVKGCLIFKYYCLITSIFCLEDYDTVG